MSNVPLPRPGPLGLIQYAGSDMQEYAAAVSAAKDAEIAGLRAELLKSLADNAALRDERDNMAGAIAQLLRDNRDVHEKVVRPLRERVRVLEDALRGMVIANERHSLLRVGDALTAARAALEQKP